MFNFWQLPEQIVACSNITRGKKTYQLLVQGFVFFLIYTIPLKATHTETSQCLKCCPHKYTLPLASLHYRWTFIDPPCHPSAPLLHASTHPLRRLVSLDWRVTHASFAALRLVTPPPCPPPLPPLSVLSHNSPSSLEVHLFTPNSPSARPSCHPSPTLPSSPCHCFTGGLRKTTNC